jgi:hypothetical protein
MEGFTKIIELNNLEKLFFFIKILLKFLQVLLDEIYYNKHSSKIYILKIIITI